MKRLISRTSPSYANYSTKSEELNQIENSICKELDTFNNQFFTLYGYNQQTHSIDQIHSILHSVNKSGEWFHLSMKEGDD